MSLKIGVLSLQGAFREHIIKIKECGDDAVEVRTPEQLEYIDGLIIPGGESTTIKKLIKKYKFKNELDKFNEQGKPIFGTCAGLILLAGNVEGEGRILGYADISVRRNAYGRQVDSFEEFVEIDLGQSDNGPDEKTDKIKFKSIFIRAPKIINTGKDVKIMASLNGDAVMVRNHNIIGCTFHPELTGDKGVHLYFKNMIKNYRGEN